MRVFDCSIPEVKRIELSAFVDGRGQFLRIHDAVMYEQAGIRGPFAQLNGSTSGEDVLRGLHFQRLQPQGKLLSVLAGAVMDVAVDLRPDSPTRGQWVRMQLDADEPAQLWIPPGFAHGFCVLRAPAVVVYQTTTPHDPADQWGIRWDDPALGIPWPTASPVVSERDAALPSWSDLAEQGVLKSLDG